MSEAVYVVVAAGRIGDRWREVGPKGRGPASLRRDVARARKFYGYAKAVPWREGMDYGRVPRAPRARA